MVTGTTAGASSRHPAFASGFLRLPNDTESAEPRRGHKRGKEMPPGTRALCADRQNATMWAKCEAAVAGCYYDAPLERIVLAFS